MRIGISIVQKINEIMGNLARNKIIAAYSDYIVAFIPRGVESPGSMSTINYAKKFGKKHLVID